MTANSLRANRGECQDRMLESLQSVVAAVGANLRNFIFPLVHVAMTNQSLPVMR